MLMRSIKCPECSGAISVDISGKEFVFCPYCGHQIEIHNPNRIEKIYTKNINVNKNFNNNNTNRLINDADVIRAKNERLDTILRLGGAVIVIFFVVFGFVFMAIDEDKDERQNKNDMQKAISEGKINVGENYAYFEGENYKTVIKQFEDMGFVNIEKLPIKDHNPFNNTGKVKTISIGGDSNFDKYDCFSPEDRVVVSYY